MNENEKNAPNSETSVPKEVKNIDPAEIPENIWSSISDEDKNEFAEYIFKNHKFDSLSYIIWCHKFATKMTQGLIERAILCGILILSKHIFIVNPHRLSNIFKLGNQSIMNHLRKIATFGLHSVNSQFPANIQSFLNLPDKHPSVNSWAARTTALDSELQAYINTNFSETELSNFGNLQDLLSTIQVTLRNSSFSNDDNDDDNAEDDSDREEIKVRKTIPPKRTKSNPTEYILVPNNDVWVIEGTYQFFSKEEINYSAYETLVPRAQKHGPIIPPPQNTEKQEELHEIPQNLIPAAFPDEKLAELL